MAISPLLSVVRVSFCISVSPVNAAPFAPCRHNSPAKSEGRKGVSEAARAVGSGLNAPLRRGTGEHDDRVNPSGHSDRARVKARRASCYRKSSCFNDLKVCLMLKVCQTTRRRSLRPVGSKRTSTIASARFAVQVGLTLQESGLRTPQAPRQSHHGQLPHVSLC